MAYDASVKINARKMFVTDGMGLREISRHLGGKPAYQVIAVWSREVDPETGFNWRDERAALTRSKYERLTTGQRAEKLLSRLDLLLADETLEGGKFANALSQISRALQDMRDPLFILPIRLETIQLLADWIAENARRYNTPSVMQFLANFKNWLVERAQKESA